MLRVMFVFSAKVGLLFQLCKLAELIFAVRGAVGALRVGRVAAHGAGRWQWCGCAAFLPGLACGAVEVAGGAGRGAGLCNVFSQLCLRSATICASVSCETCRLTLRNGLFHHAKRAVSHCETARFAIQALWVGVASSLIVGIFLVLQARYHGKVARGGLPHLHAHLGA